MGSGSKELTGPDLRQGVLAAELSDGGMLLGHADGEAVLLARRGTDVFAIGATCTHYGAPLADGIVVGEMVRCPWHHACFSLRTGEPVAAPALNAVPCWNVVKKGDLLTLGARRQPGRPTAPAHAPPRIVIVGAGAAAAAAAEVLRREGYIGDVTMIGDEDTVPVDRPNLSKDYLAGAAPEEWIPLRSRAFYAEQHIELILGTRATSIDLDYGRVVLADGRSVLYRALILATGAEPIRLRVPGGELPHVRALRSLADSRAIIALAEPGKRAVVVGASFIGLEAAAALRTRGVEVSVVAPGRVPFERVLGPDVGRFVQRLHEEHGVRFHFGKQPQEIDETHVTLSNGGERLAADLVVTGIGVRPRVELAEAAGLRCDDGILVDEHLETSARGVYAVGDVARYLDLRTRDRLRVEHWVVAQRQGQSVARSLAGRHAPYGDVPFFWTQHYDVQISYVGHATRWDRIDTSGSVEGRDCLLAYRQGGRIAAVATINRDRACLEAEAALELDDQAALERLVAR